MAAARLLSIPDTRGVLGVFCILQSGYVAMVMHPVGAAIPLT